MEFLYCSISTVIDPKNSLSQSGVFCEMVETGINILNRDLYKWKFIVSLTSSYISLQVIKVVA